MKMIQKSICLFVLFAFFLSFPAFQGNSNDSSPPSSTEVITSEDLALSRIPLYLLLVENEKIMDLFDSFFDFQEEELISKKQYIVELFKILGDSPSFFSSRDRLRVVLNQKLQEELELSQEDSERISALLVSPETIRSLNDALRVQIKKLNVKAEFSPGSIIIEKEGEKKVFVFKDYSEENIAKEEVQEVLANIKIPKNVVRVEGINSNEMISPIALTDNGKTILFKKGVQSSQIKPIMFVRPINRYAIARASRRGKKNKEKISVKINNASVPFYNLTSLTVQPSQIETFLSSFELPSSIKQIDYLVSKKMGEEGVALTDSGETLLVSVKAEVKKNSSENYQFPVDRRGILDRSSRKKVEIDMNTDLLTIPAMISGLDLREVYELLVEEFVKDKYDIDINYSSELIAVAIIRSTTERKSYVSLTHFKKALIQQGVEPRLAALLANREVAENISQIIYRIRERVLAMSGKKVVIYIDNREVPLLTTGSNANYTPRQITLAQERLVKERFVLSQVDEVVLVENLQRNLGYTVRSEGKIKAYVSQVVLMDDILMPKINWMPTMGDFTHLQEVPSQNTVISTAYPFVKMILVAPKEMDKAAQEINEKGTLNAFVYREKEGLTFNRGKSGKNKVSFQELIEKGGTEKVGIVVEDSLLSAIDIELASWMFGKNFVIKAISLEGNGRFRSETDDTEYDFTPLSEEYVESLHRSILEQNVLILKEDLIKKRNLFIDGVRVVPSSDFSIGRMDARIRKLPFDQAQKKEYVHERVVLELGEDLAIALMNGDISNVHLKRVLKGGKVKLAPEEKRKWDRQRKLYQAKIQEGSRFDLFSGDSLSEDASKHERMFAAGLNKAFHKSTNWIEDRIDGVENLKEYHIQESLDTTFQELFELSQKKENLHLVKISALLKIYSNVQAKNALMFKSN